MITRVAIVMMFALSALSCRKVPISDVDAFFVKADTSWFQEEETLFLFYEVTAEQGIGDPSVIEIAWATDDERIAFTPIDQLPWVHTHLPVDCGEQTLCGSASFHVPIAPREVKLRLRYHAQGDLALDAPMVYNVVERGPAHTNRSLLVYGVFDETNQLVQWRSRHNFPTLRNKEAETYGLRRTFVVEDMAFGGAALATPSNPYGYGVACPDNFVATELPDVTTAERAVFQLEPLPLGASNAPTVCASATVTDAVGTYTTGAVARKNPEVRPAFPSLHSPIRETAQLKFFLGPCERTISAEHEAMQRQRLLLGDVPTTCIDDWDQPGFVDSLVVTFRDAIEDRRSDGLDMVLVIGLHQDELGVSEVLEQALVQVLPPERHRSTPRVAGAMVLDSDIYEAEDPEIARSTLWCPSNIEGDVTDASVRSCAILPDNPSFELGPFSFGSLPILPSRDQYLDFVEDYSEDQAGYVQTLSFLAPEFPTTSDHVDLAEFGVVTFLNNESISADDDDAFSYCVDDTLEVVVFRSELLTSGELPFDCEYFEYLGIPDACDGGLVPLEYLPEWHDAFAEDAYEIGVFWEFPYLLRMFYELVQAGQVSAFGFSVPFGFASPTEAYYGTVIWTEDEFTLEDNLTQCDRYCEHPTFDSAGVYHVTDPFWPTYAHLCYLPVYPKPGGTGFPLDP